MKQLWLAALAVVVSVMMWAPAEAVAKKDSYPVNVTGSVSNGGTFAGVFHLEKFIRQGDKIVAMGRLTGTITNPDGSTMDIESGKKSGGGKDFQQKGRKVQMPVNVAGASCDILNLVLGPLHLDLLGLVIDLNQVNLDITAQQGPGNLLGNLLCGITGLLDNVAQLNTLIGRLNEILGVLLG